MTSVLLIAVSGVDWAGFDAATTAGIMPGMAALRTRGLAGPLRGAAAGEGPAAWTSLVTGRQPEDHGVWRDVEAWQGGVRPVGPASWRTAPLWARLEAAGVSSGRVVWPAARRGAAWPGAFVDEDFILASSRFPEDWALPLGCVPRDLRETLRDRRVHPASITAAMLEPFVEDLRAVDHARDIWLPQLAVAMARAATAQAAAMWMTTQKAPEAIFAHQPWLGLVRGAFERRPEAALSRVVPVAWRFLDELIGALAAAAGPRTQVVVVSPGWRGRPGLVLATGPDIADDPGAMGVDILDIAPTMLARFGLEDAALGGQPIPGLTPPGLRSRAPEPPPPPSPAVVDVAEIEGLRKAGYRPPDGPPPAFRAQGLAELGWILLERAEPAAAAAADEALQIDPANLLALSVRARALIARGDPERLPPVAVALLAVAPDRGWGPVAYGAYHVMRQETPLAAPWLRRAESDPDPATRIAVGALWLAAGRPASAGRVFASVLDQEPLHVAAEIGLAMVAMTRRDFVTAEAALRRARRLDPGRPAIALQMAQLYARTGRTLEAGQAAEIALRLGAPSAMVEAARFGRLRG